MEWSSYPPEHKRSFKAAIFGFTALVAAVGGWLWLTAAPAVKAFDARVPQASVAIKPVYSTPEMAENTTSTFTSDTTVLPPGDGEGYVGIIMTDLGVSEAASNRALEDLPQQVALAFSPYSQHVAALVEQAVAAKRETLMLVPMEPLSYPHDDPGPRALLTRVAAKDNSDNLSWILRDAKGVTGAMNFMGSSFMSDPKSLLPVFQTLRQRGAVFVENPAPAGPMGLEAAMNAELPYITADLRIDETATELNVKAQLLALENLARKRGYALGIAQPYPLSFTILKSWAESLSQRGITLVPLSSIIKTKAQHDKAAETEKPAEE
ncbi:MAG: divergent polysaccharide deacetylase family protein [Alphaproteobacteria bacterium]